MCSLVKIKAAHILIVSPLVIGDEKPDDGIANVLYGLANSRGLGVLMQICLFNRVTELEVDDKSRWREHLARMEMSE
jgi:hypothetical protein